MSNPDGVSPKTKSDFLRLLSRHVANAMFCQNPDNYTIRMRPEELHLSGPDLNVTSNKGYARSLNRVKKAFSFNKTPTTSRLTRAVSSMISPLTSSSNHNANNGQPGAGAAARDRRLSSTPSGFMQNLRLQSCVDLHAPDSISVSSQESPRSTRSFARRQQTLMGPPPAASPARSTASTASSSSISSMPPPTESPAKSLGGFALPKTPTLCVRRASFKFLTNPMAKKQQQQ